MMKKRLILTMILLFVLGCNTGNSAQKEAKKSMAETKGSNATATFAGGCFWCVESDFEKVPGVLKVVSGYTGGSGENPTYETYHDKGHIEAVQVFYDPAKVTMRNCLMCSGGISILRIRGGNLSTGGPGTGAPFFTTTKSRGGLRKNPRRNWQNPGGLPNRL